MIGSIPVKSFSEQNSIAWDKETETVIAEDVNDAYLSVPTILGRKGIEKVLNIQLSHTEQEKFVSSANLMKQYIDRINDK